MIDELAYAGPEHLDTEFVAGYDRKQGYPDPEQELAVFAAQGLGPQSVLVDLGAGTGQFALPAARRFGQVIAVDISPVMVRQLTERAAAAGLANLHAVRAGFLSYEHQGPPADGVYTRHALHQLPDFWKTIALGRIARLLRPGGTLVYCTCSLEPEEGEQAVSRFLAAEPSMRRAPIEASEVAGLAEIVTAEGDLRTLPCHLPHDDPRLGGLDGFYAARLVKS